jgi:putative nucleotidyltransferase with HDIG domain
MSYYHDIGKTLRPNFFIENQVSSNIHDELTPSLSAQVIAAHVKDGVELAKKYKLPQNIIDGIEQHHGTSLITYFYHRALQDSDSEDLSTLSEEKFRYPGPKPQSKESAILHLADMTEAAGRILTPGADVREFVTSLINKTKNDGQLDEADLTFRETQMIIDSFVRTLAALRHDRVAYPQPIKNLEQEPDSSPDHSSERTGS